MFQYQKSNGVGYYYSTLLKSKHAFSTRIGGVSTLPETSSLNLAFARGDDNEIVLQNLRLFADAVGIDADRVISLPQIHGADVLYVSEADAGRGYVKDANGASDGYITDVSGLPLGVKSADCVPILLEMRDADGNVLAVSAVHAGWRGTAGGIAARAVKALRNLCAEGDIFAAIGPCIGACCFEIGADCAAVFAENLCEKIVKKCLKTCKNDQFLCDLSLINRLLLQEAGVADAHIDVASLCTCCHPSEFFSHRYAAKHQNGQRGTMLSVICKS